MTDIKQRDIVDVSFRGTVRFTDTYKGKPVLTVVPEGDDYEGSVYGIRPDWVTVVVPPVKAGDEVTGQQAHRLPIGSTVLYEPGGGVSVKVSDIQWISVGPDTSVISNTIPYEPTWAFDVKLKVLHVGRER